MNHKILLIVFGLIALLTSCQPTTTAEAPTTKKGLIKIAIMYPNAEGNTFDMDYYANKHMPMIANLFGESMKFMEIDQGISGRTAEDEIPYLAVGYFFFESIEAYQNAFGPHAEQILGDIPNYTNIRPVILISEVIR